MNEAAEKTGGKPTEEQQQQFNALPDDIAVLQEDLQRLLGEAEGITCANPRVVRFLLHCRQAHSLHSAVQAAVTTACLNMQLPYAK